jgi:hypothetical protein
LPVDDPIESGVDRYLGGQGGFYTNKLEDQPPISWGAKKTFREDPDGAPVFCFSTEMM